MRRHRVPISCDEASSGTHERAGAHDGHGHLLPHSQGQRALRATGAAARSSSAADMRSTVPEGGLQTLTGRSAPARTARLVGALTLRNPSNYCYMNVSVRGLLWAMLPWLDSAVHFTKSGRETLRLLLQHNNQSVFIYGTPIWRMLLHRWEAASSQHDASEFLAFLLSKLCTPMVTWRWEARLITDADCEVLDRGDSMQANHCFTRGMLRLTCMPWQAMRSCYFFGWLVTGSEQAA